jgi:hypothetical protein
MKAITVLVATSILGVHVPKAQFKVDEDSKTIFGEVDSFADEAGREGGTVLRTSSFSAPMIEGKSDEESIDEYLQANISTVVGGIVVELPAAPASSEQAAS